MAAVDEKVAEQRLSSAAGGNPHVNDVHACPPGSVFQENVGLNLIFLTPEVRRGDTRAGGVLMQHELQLVWNDASGRHWSLMHWRQSIIGFPMHQRLVANQCIIPIELQLVWNDASGHHRPDCHPS